MLRVNLKTHLKLAVYSRNGQNRGALIISQVQLAARTTRTNLRIRIYMLARQSWRKPQTS